MGWTAPNSRTTCVRLLHDCWLDHGDYRSPVVVGATRCEETIPTHDNDDDDGHHCKLPLSSWWYGIIPPGGCRNDTGDVTRYVDESMDTDDTHDTHHFWAFMYVLLLHYSFQATTGTKTFVVIIEQNSDLGIGVIDSTLHRLRHGFINIIPRGRTSTAQ